MNNSPNRHEFPVQYVSIGYIVRCECGQTRQLRHKSWLQLYEARLHTHFADNGFKIQEQENTLLRSFVSCKKVDIEEKML